jgi:hypothetical protein
MRNEFVVAAATTSAVIAGIASVFVMVISNSCVYVTDVSNTGVPFQCLLNYIINIVNPPLISTMQRQRHARDGTYNSGRH